MPRALITGITGQDGLYLSELLLSKGYEVFGLIRGHNNPKEGLVHETVPDATVMSGDLQDLSSLTWCASVAKASGWTTTRAASRSAGPHRLPSAGLPPLGRRRGGRLRRHPRRPRPRTLDARQARDLLDEYLPYRRPGGRVARITPQDGATRPTRPMCASSTPMVFEPGLARRAERQSQLFVPVPAPTR